MPARPRAAAAGDAADAASPPLKRRARHAPSDAVQTPTKPPSTPVSALNTQRRARPPIDILYADVLGCCLSLLPIRDATGPAPLACSAFRDALKLNGAC